MEIKVSNHIEIIDPSKKVEEYAKNYLVIENPEYSNKMRMGFYVKDIEKYLTLYVQNGNKLILPFGCLKEIFKIAKEENVVVENLISKKEEKNYVFTGLKLYNYQEKAVSMLLNGKNGVLQAPCGAGKTQIGIALIEKVNKKTLWLTHTIDLMKQSMERAKKYFPNGKYGTITNGKVNIGEDITFATVQTMCKIDPSIYKNEFGCVIVDECHRCIGTPTQVKMFYKVLSNLNCRYKYGLTATSKRSDKLDRCMYAIIGELLHVVSVKELEGKIINAEHVRVDINIEYDEDSYLKTDGTADYSKMIECISFNSHRNNIIVENIVSVSKQGRTQLVLCERVAQVHSIAEKIRKLSHELDVAIVTGATSNKNRRYNAKVIVATYSLAKEGLDIPTLDTLHLATPQKNKTTIIQSVGRIERNIEGKKTPIVYDYVDTHITYCENAYILRKRYIKNKNKK